MANEPLQPPQALATVAEVKWEEFEVEPEMAAYVGPELLDVLGTVVM